MCIESLKQRNWTSWHETDTGGVGGGFGRSVEHYHCRRDTAAARRQSEAWGAWRWRLQPALRTWNFWCEKSQAECLCLPATVTVMLLDQEVDCYVFFRRQHEFPSRCTKLLLRRPRWKTWHRCCLRMPLASIWLGDLRPIRSKMKPFVASAENSLED